VEKPLLVQAESVIEVGSIVRGELTSVVSGSDGQSTPSLTLVFREVVDHDGAAHRIQARPLVVAGAGPAEEAEGAGTGEAAAGTDLAEAAPDVPVEGAEDEAAPAAEAPAEELAAPAEPAVVQPGPILAAGPEPLLLPASGGEIVLPSGQEVRVELAALTQLPL
jgi:hypothetical protein